jgi:murein DD-endopeptidase MepM/ murein hydrolase activator NlpD
VLAAAVATPAARLSREAGLIDPAIAVPVAPAAANKAAIPQGDTATAVAAASIVPPAQYLEHTIAAGETLGSIASSYGVSVATIEANNQGLSDFNVIHSGQTLRIPTTNGVLYSVRQGDTVRSISQRFGVSSSAILDLGANNLQNADTIHAGQTLLVPVEVKDVAPVTPAPVVITRPIVVPPSQPALSPPSHPPAAAATAVHTAAPKPAQATAVPHAAAPAAVVAPKPVAPAAPKPVTPPPAPPTAVAVVSRFIWPVQGIITQGFGVPELGYGAPHTGIDIAVPVGTPVAAGGNGTVIFAGGDPCCSFGYYIVIAHPGGLETLYGHLSHIGVSVGQAVSQGQIIGNSGNTGYSTGPHVHFQVQIGEVPVNPLQYLP